MVRSFEAWVKESPAREAVALREAVVASQVAEREVRRARAQAKRTWHELGSPEAGPREGAIELQIVATKERA